MKELPICCDTSCEQRLSCAKFLRAIDVNAGKIKYGYYIIDKCEYEK